MPTPFFFPTKSGEALFGVWRGQKTARWAWILAPPLAEEEKSARRVLTELAQFLAVRDGASLLFSFRGQGDSEGDFSQSSLQNWSDDLRAAASEARQRAPIAQIGILGVRLGASLALQNAAALGASELILVEPILSGRSLVVQMNLRKKLRAELTSGEAAKSEIRNPTEVEDLDGWAFGARLRDDLNALDLRKQPKFEGKAAVFQVGPRAEVAAPLQNFAETLGAKTRAVAMPAFWNLLDYAPATPLLEALET